MAISRLPIASSALALCASVTIAKADDMYVSVFGGLNFTDGSEGSALSGTGITFASTNVETSADDGYVFGGAIGFGDWMEGARFEIEASYRSNDIDGTFAIDAFFDSSGFIEAEQTVWAGMANLWFDIPTNHMVTPYIGGGIGWANSEIEGNFHTTVALVPGTTPFDDDESGFAWQLGAGINIAVSDRMNLGIGYRYFDAPQIEGDLFLGKNDVPLGVDSTNHSVAVNLSYQFE